MRECLRVALAVLIPMATSAQQRPDSASPTPAAPRTITGVIADTSDKVVDSAEVFIPSLKRKMAAGLDGTFRFDDVKPGTYEIAARRLGYYPQTRTVVVTKQQGAATRFALVPFSRTLPPVISSSTRGGLSGVIGDTAFGAIKGAEVSVIASSRRALSDSLGAFFVDLPPGKHLVRVKRDGYASQLVTVTVPRDSGRRMLVLLKPTLRDESIQEQIAIDELEMRMARRNAVYSALFTREEINKVGWEELSQIAQAGAGRYVDPGCLAIVDGGPRREYIWALRASDIEGVEVYRARQRRMEVRTITGGGRVITGNLPIGRIPQPFDNCQDEVYVWLRK